VAEERWKNKPEAQDLSGAKSYLSLLVGPQAAAKLVKALGQQRTLEYHPAKDLLRSSGLPLLARDDSEVAADLEKVTLGKKLTPVLLVQGVPLWVADGYHRMCASYYIDEKALVPCRIIPGNRRFD
jgi:hypothetical protein